MVSLDGLTHWKILLITANSFPSLGRWENAKNHLSQTWENQKTEKNGRPKVGKTEKRQKHPFPKLGNPKKLKSCISQDWDNCFLNNNLNIKKHGNKENLFTYAPKHGALPVCQPCGRPLRRNQHRTRHRWVFRPSLTPRRRSHEEIQRPFFL